MNCRHEDDFENTISLRLSEPSQTGTRVICKAMDGMDSRTLLLPSDFIMKSSPRRLTIARDQPSINRHRLSYKLPQTWVRLGLSSEYVLRDASPSDSWNTRSLVFTPSATPYPKFDSTVAHVRLDFPYLRETHTLSLTFMYHSQKVQMRARRGKKVMDGGRQHVQWDHDETEVCDEEAMASGTPLTIRDWGLTRYYSLRLQRIFGTDVYVFEIREC